MSNKFLDLAGSVPPSMWLRIGLLALVQSFQFVILISYFLLFFPVYSQVHFTVPLCISTHPHRDSQIYWLGILFFNAMLLLIAMMGFKNTQRGRSPAILWAILVEIIILMVLFAGLHLKLVGDQVVPIPNALFIVGSLSAVFAKALLPGVWRSVSGAYSDHIKHAPVHVQGPVFTREWFYLFIFISLFCALGFYIPDMHALFDAAYFGERQVTNQTFVLSAAYWSYSGGLPGINGESFYGVGLPILIGQMCKLAGSFDWEMIFQVVLWLIIFYAAAWFVLYTRVFRSPWLALAVWFLFLKFRLLSSEGGALMTMVNFPASPLRFYGDVFFLAAICAHWSSRKRAWLTVAACIAAFQLFLVTSIGSILCVMMVFYLLLYVAASGPMARQQAVRDVLLGLAASIALYGSIMFCIYGSHLADAVFWDNFFIWLKLYRNGFLNGSYIYNLFINPGAFFLSLGFITLYLLGLWPAVCLVLQRRFSDVRPMLAVILSIYGILHYQHFMWYADPVVLQRNASIVLFLIFIWYDILIEAKSRSLKQRLSVVLLIGAVILFFNAPKWQSYPNIFHSEARMMETMDNSFLKEAFDTTYVFDQDVQLIQKLTAPADHVPIVSGHELLLLIKSHRKPFFYVFPLIYSDQIGQTGFPQDQIFTTGQLQRTLDQIRAQKPPVIFVQRNLFQAPLPASSQGIDVPLVQILREIMRSYAPVAKSPYLVALRRRE